MDDKYDSKVENSAQSDVTDTKKIESEITDLAEQDSEKLKKSKGCKMIIKLHALARLTQ